MVIGDLEAENLALKNEVAQLKVQTFEAEKKVLRIQQELGESLSETQILDGEISRLRHAIDSNKEAASLCASRIRQNIQDLLALA